MTYIQQSFLNLSVRAALASATVHSITSRIQSFIFGSDSEYIFESDLELNFESDLELNFESDLVNFCSLRRTRSWTLSSASMQ